MRRLTLVAVLGAALLVAGALPAGADPHNGASAITLDLTCDPGGPISVLNQFNTGTMTMFDSAVDGDNGRKYVAVSTNERYYVGEFAEEPVGDPDYAFQKTWGKRNGYEERLECTGGPLVVEFGDMTITGWFDTVLAGK